MADDRYSLAEARAIIDAEKCEKGDAGNWCATHQYAWPTGDECKARPEVADVAAQLLTEPRDDHHTMGELYEYRMLYNAHAAQGWLADGIPVVKSLRHSDGELCFGGGWFIVTATLPTGQVSNHYEMSDWWLFRVPTVETAPEWDGHTPQDAAKRLRAAINGEEETDCWPAYEPPVPCPHTHVSEFHEAVLWSPSVRVLRRCEDCGADLSDDPINGEEVTE